MLASYKKSLRAAFVALFFLTSSYSFAQSAGNSTSVVGAVTDPTGAGDAFAGATTAARERPVPAQTIAIRPRPPNVVSLWRRSPWVATLAAVLVVGLVSFGAFTYENQPVAAYELSGSVPGKAVVVVRRSGAAELEMDGVPDPEPGFVYEAWVIPQAGKPIAAGIMSTGEARVPLPGDVRGSTVAITRERTRVDAPTSDPLMATVVQS